MANGIKALREPFVTPEQDETAIQSYRQDAAQLYNALAALVDAYFYGPDAIKPFPLSTRQAHASFNAGRALRTHVDFDRSKNPQED